MRVMRKEYQTKGGFLRAVLIFIAVIAAIVYFDIDVRSIVESDVVQTGIAWVQWAWGVFLKLMQPVVDVVKDIFSTETTLPPPPEI